MSTRSSQQKTDVPDGTFCPLLKGMCVTHKCMWYIRLQGANTQTGEMLDKYMCAVPALIFTTLEGNKETRQAAAAVESLRNVQAEAGAKVREALESFPRERLVDAVTDR